MPSRLARNPLVPNSNPGGPANEFKNLAILAWGTQTGWERVFNLTGIGFTARTISAILSRT